MRTLTGVITSHAMNKTVVVRVDVLKMHAKYKKQYRVSRRYKAHDERGEYRSGDTVVIAETRPLSREKRWKVVSLVKRPVAVEQSDAA